MTAWKLPGKKPFPIDYLSLLIASQAVSTPIFKCDSWKLNITVIKERGWDGDHKKKKKMQSFARFSVTEDNLKIGKNAVDKGDRWKEAIP